MRSRSRTPEVDERARSGKSDFHGLWMFDRCCSVNEQRCAPSQVVSRLGSTISSRLIPGGWRWPVVEPYFEFDVIVQPSSGSYGGSEPSTMFIVARLMRAFASSCAVRGRPSWYLLATNALAGLTVSRPSTTCFDIIMFLS